MRILVTGASGFIGSFIVEEALDRGMEVWAAVRKSSSLKYLSDKRIHLITLDFSNKAQLVERFRETVFDYVVHAAGVTKSANKEDFHTVNTLGTRNFVEALIEAGVPLRRFVYLSSLSIFGPIRESHPYQEIRDTDPPQPNTAYGKSKLEAERFLGSLNDFPYIILRPTGVYGPRERDYFLMAQSIRNHLDFAVGYKPQDITFVYVKDVVQAVFLSLENGTTGKAYFLSDGKVYNSRDFSDLLRKELGNPWLLRIKAPLCLLRIVTAVGDVFGRVTHRVTALNNDKYNIMRQRNWRCDIHPAMDELGYAPEYDLEKGVKEAVKWYKDNKWL